MFGIGTPWAFLFEHPIVGLVVFAAVSAGVIIALSGGQLGASLGGIFRVFFTIFTTPFTFLRDALTMMRTSQDEEQDYAQSSVFMLYRENRIFYMALLVLCLLMLGGGLTTALISVYPQAELTQSKYWGDQVAQIQTELATAQQNVTTAAAPGNADRLYNVRQQALGAYQAHLQSERAFMQTVTFTGTAIDAVSNAGSAEAVAQVRTNIDAYMTGCPRAWRNMTLEMCGQFRAYALELASRREREFALAQAYNNADSEWRQASDASQHATAALNDAQARLDSAKQQLATVSPWDPQRLGARIMAAALMMLSTLWSVIVVVWVGATLIDVFNWIVLMMRSLEKSQAAKLVAMRDRNDGMAA